MFYEEIKFKVANSYLSRERGSQAVIYPFIHTPVQWTPFIIIIIVKITWHLELGKETPPINQNYATWRAIEQQKDTEIKRGENRAKPSSGASS